MKTSDDSLLAMPALRHLTDTTKAAVSRFSMRKHFKKNEIIFRENDSANRFYIIENGNVDLGYFGSGNDHHMETLGAGDVLGYSWMIEPYRWQSDAKATSDVDAIFIYATPLRAFCEEHPQIGWELMTWCAAILTKRLQHRQFGFVPGRNCCEAVCSKDPWPWTEPELVSLP